MDRAWPDDEESDPDLYLNVGDPEITLTKYDWRSANIGPDRIEVNTADPKFRATMDDGGPAYYFIGVMPYREGLNTMNVQLTLIEASKISLIYSIRACSYSYLWSRIQFNDRRVSIL